MGWVGLIYLHTHPYSLRQNFPAREGRDLHPSSFKGLLNKIISSASTCFMMCLQGLLIISEVEACNITGPLPADTPDKTQICVSIKITGCFDGDGERYDLLQPSHICWDIIPNLLWLRPTLSCGSSVGQTSLCLGVHWACTWQQRQTRWTLNNFPAERAEIDRVVFKRSGRVPKGSHGSGRRALMHTR